MINFLVRFLTAVLAVMVFSVPPAKATQSHDQVDADVSIETVDSYLASEVCELDRIQVTVNYVEGYQMAYEAIEIPEGWLFYIDGRKSNTYANVNEPIALALFNDSEQGLTIQDFNLNLKYRYRQEKKIKSDELLFIKEPPSVWQAGIFPLIAETENSPLKDFLINNWVALLVGLFGFIEVVVRLTPTEKDDSLFNKIKAIFDVVVPNFKKGGGTY